MPRPTRQLDPDAFDALGDPQRRAILTVLAEHPRAVGEIAAELPVSRPAVSFHLRLLREAGLVEERREGTRRIYALRREGLEAVRRYLDELWTDAAVRFRLTAENTSEDR